MHIHLDYHHIEIFLNFITANDVPVWCGVYLNILHIHLDYHHIEFTRFARYLFIWICHTWLYIYFEYHLSDFFYHHLKKRLTCLVRYLSKHTAHISWLPSYRYLYYLHRSKWLTNSVWCLSKHITHTPWLPSYWMHLFCEVFIYLNLLYTYMYFEYHKSDFFYHNHNKRLTCLVRYLSKHIAHTSWLPSYRYLLIFITASAW